MLEKLKESKIKPINEELNIYGEELKETVYELESIKGGLQYLRKQKYSFFDKLFNKKKIVENKEKINNREKEFYELSSRIDELTKNIKLLTLKKRKIENISSISDFGFENINEIYKYCSENNIEITEEDTKILKSSSKAYMLEILEKDYHNISYDTTNDIDVYKKFLELQLQKKNNITGTIDDDIYCVYTERILNRLNELDAMADSNKRQFNLYLFELYRNNPDGLIDYAELYKKYMSKDCVEIENLCLNNNVIIGVHGTRYIPDNANENDIFMNGLKNSTQSNAILDINRIIEYENLTFLDIIDYDASKRAGAKLGLNYNYLVVIPKLAMTDSNIPIWGTDDVNSDDNYILPQYIYGYFTTNKAGELELIRNTLKDCHKYEHYYSFDGELIDKKEEIKK